MPAAVASPSPDIARGRSASVRRCREFRGNRIRRDKKVPEQSSEGRARWKSKLRVVRDQAARSVMGPPELFHVRQFRATPALSLSWLLPNSASAPRGRAKMVPLVIALGRLQERLRVT